MTTITEEKINREQELIDAPNMIVDVRVKVIQAVELADEMKTATGVGLNNPYPEITEFYGKQRAILRGLTSSSVMKFNLPDAAQWNGSTAFTLPTKTLWGYEFYDTDGNPATLDNPDLCYLAKRIEGNIPCTIESDMGAFTAPVALLDYKQVIGRGDDSTTQYSFELSSVAVPGTIKIMHDDLQIGQDDGAGVLSGTNIINSTADYTTNAVVLEYSEAVEQGVTIAFVFDSYSNESGFTDTYNQVDFTLGSKSYGSGLTLDLISIASGVLDQRPALLETMLVRKKADHQPVGTLKIVCEGLKTDASWACLIDDPEDATLLSHSEFKSMLGYLNPDYADDLMKSANPYLFSSGRKDGDDYPDTEASPMFPCTDGDYTGSNAFTGNWVHYEDEVYEWSVHSDIKWQYGTEPENDGDKAQYDPESVLDALNAIAGFTGGSTDPIPNDTGSSASPGKSYEMNGNFVWVYTWTGTAPSCTKDSGVEYSCYYNDVQHLKEDQDHLIHLQTQCGLIAELGDVSNAVDVSRQAGDTQFITDTATFKAELDKAVFYHDTFTPLTNRTEYVTTDITALQTATDPGGYLSTVTDRLNDLDSVIGTPTTGGYTKTIYDACNCAVNKDIGYVRAVLDKLNSIGDIYDLISKKQSEYTMFP